MELKSKFNKGDVVCFNYSEWTVKSLHLKNGGDDLFIVAPSFEYEIERKIVSNGKSFDDILVNADVRTESRLVNEKDLYTKAETYNAMYPKPKWKIGDKCMSKKYESAFIISDIDYEHQTATLKGCASFNCYTTCKVYLDDLVSFDDWKE